MSQEIKKVKNKDINSSLNNIFYENQYSKYDTFGKSSPKYHHETKVSPKYE